MWHSDEADDQRVMADIHNRNMDAPHIEAVLGHVGEALLVAEADEDPVAGEADALYLAQPGVKLALQLVNNLRHAHITEQRVVFCTIHVGVWLTGGEPNNAGSGGRHCGGR